MKRIALIADKNTVTCFKLAGLSDVYLVETEKEAKKITQKLLEKNHPQIILVSERLLKEIKTLDKISEPKSPLIIPIPDLQGQKLQKTNLMVDLIKRKTGIEVNL